jgi:LPPG:FO 2-phospho-L-lactate transferase
MTVVGLGGGIGASRLWRALAAVVDPGDLTLVVNTGDDSWMHGLRVCPDLDTTLYALSDRQDRERGWGLRGESFRCMEDLAQLGEPVWFNLGDLDLATHLYRTGRLRAGVGLAQVTADLARAMGVRVRVLPLTEHEVSTRVVSADGQDLHYEEFLVREQARPRVCQAYYDGADTALPTSGVVATIERADLVVLAPSNPLASIGPILAVPGVRDALRAVRERVVAVTPIVNGVAIADAGERRRALSRARLLDSIGLPATATAVAGLYRDLCREFVLDRADADETEAVRALGAEPVLCSTLFTGQGAGHELVELLLTRARSRRACEAAEARPRRTG